MDDITPERKSRRGGGRGARREARAAALTSAHLILFARLNLLISSVKRRAS